MGLLEMDPLQGGANVPPGQLHHVRDIGKLLLQVKNPAQPRMLSSTLFTSQVQEDLSNLRTNLKNIDPKDQVADPGSPKPRLWPVARIRRP